MHWAYAPATPRRWPVGRIVLVVFTILAVVAILGYGMHRALNPTAEDEWNNEQRAKQQQLERQACLERAHRMYPPGAERTLALQNCE